ncbi:MAG: hypothetical protein EB163_07300 [Nitrososphaeria archaeon]|nr:hypothetical protein [Nitrososphaeria archaeon]NDB52179.1 hypothetical protein [Nitrosopumilaceae archaeon]NDB89575.1 hypothetical protein [Nitrososphaerota archaeon]NDF46772.1 hypothetical protein [Nitrosopumilaceae archaeon]
MKGDILLQNIQARGFIPATAGKNVKEDKKKIKDMVETKLGKNIDSVRKRIEGKPLSISITFYVKKDSPHANKDNHSLSNVLLAVLSPTMASGKEVEKGLDIIKDESVLYKISVEKKLVESEKEEGLAFSVYEWSTT